VKPAKQLAVAAAQGDLAAMRAMLAPAPSLAHDWQPLMDACFAGQVGAVDLLLEHGADPNVVSRSTFRYRPLHRTIERKVTVPRTEQHVAVVERLLAAGADPLAPGTMAQVSAIMVAAQAGDRRFLPALLSHTPGLDLHHAAALGDRERVRALLAADPALARQPAANGWSALRCCCQSRLGEGDPERAAALREVAALLVESGADPRGALDAVVYLNDPELVALFLEHGATIEDGDTLNHAACDGAHAALDALVRHGTDLNLTAGTEHHGGYVPFGCTLTMRSLRGARWFLDQGVDPNFVGGNAGESSLHVAVRSGGGPDLLQLLVDRGADPNARDAAGLTPLAAARAKAHRTAIEFLSGIGALG
jgi:ankyrin repeat protein